MRPYGIGILTEIVTIQNRPPTAADDVTFAYFKGQFWIDEITGKCYQCLNHLPAGAAAWVEISGGGSGGLVWRGAWSNVTSYAINDSVSYNNSSYIAIQPSLNQLPTNPAFWDVLASGGISQAFADATYRTKPSYVHSQGVAASVWTINHNLNTYPSVTIRDSTGDVVEADVQYPTLNTATVTAAFAFSGSALLT